MEDIVAKQGDAFTDDGESSEENSESEMKKSIGLKELQVCVTDINLMQPGVTNGASVKRGRGRPKGLPNKASANKANINGENSPKKRGRPKSSTLKAGDLNGGSAKRPLGRPKRSVVRKIDYSGDESDDSFSLPRKRGRPKGAPKKPKRDTEINSDNEAAQSTPKRGPGRPSKSPAKGKRGRPKKITQDGAKTRPAADGTQSLHKRPGRPKGSRNKSVITMRVENTSGRPARVHVAPDKLNIPLPRKYPGKRGRPKKSNRGRPRKTPLPPEEELYQPRVWKALGRPRKYPKEEHPEQALALENTPRGRGRPRKSESKKGAHLRKLESDGSPRKPGRSPKAAKEEGGSPRKRGRPKGSFKNKALVDNSSEKTSPDSDHSLESAAPEENLTNDKDITVAE